VVLPDFRNLENLRRLDLSGNLLSGSLPETFLFNVSRLFESADLSNNRLTGFMEFSYLGSSACSDNMFMLSSNALRKITSSVAATVLAFSTFFCMGFAMRAHREEVVVK
jgi:Leucine-rich repeat (LRR) protein